MKPIDLTLYQDTVSLKDSSLVWTDEVSDQHVYRSYIDLDPEEFYEPDSTSLPPTEISHSFQPALAFPVDPDPGLSGRKSTVFTGGEGWAFGAKKKAY